MPLIPTYDPKSFASVDLRKYHVRDIKDVIKFHEFVSTRMEECSYVLKKFNTQMATFKTVSRQLQRKQEEQQAAYGNPNYGKEEKETQSNAPEIQTVDRSLEKQHEELLQDIRGAAAEEKLAEQLDSDEPVEAILGKYKLVYGKKGPMYYREGEDGKVKLVKKADVPEDIKQQLLSTIGKDE